MSQLDVEALVLALHRHEVRYVLFGTLGAIAYGANLATRDMDICPTLDEQNLRNIAALLTELGAKPRYVPGDGDEAACAAWTPQPLTPATFDNDFATPYGSLDIVPAPHGPSGTAARYDYERLNRRATTLTAFGVRVRVAHIDDLIASKMSRRRPKDVAAFAELRLTRTALAGGTPAGTLERYAQGHPERVNGLGQRRSTNPSYQFVLDHCRSLC